jgi:inorganic pyrophosphatase
MKMRMAQLLLAGLVTAPCLAGQATSLEAGEKNLLTGYPAVSESGMVHVVVEIPTGTRAKWETRADGSGIDWEVKNGALRVVKYLPYPANYGMIPGTLLSKESGGDGDPLDVVLLGPAVPRGQVVEARLIGVLKLTDEGEQDDKLIAVLPGDLLDVPGGIGELEERFPGVTTILETWFSSYKGAGVLESGGMADAAAAMKVLHEALEPAYPAR